MFFVALSIGLSSGPDVHQQFKGTGTTLTANSLNTLVQKAAILCGFAQMGGGIITPPGDLIGLGLVQSSQMSLCLAYKEQDVIGPTGNEVATSDTVGDWATYQVSVPLS